MMDTQVDFTMALLDPNIPAPANLVGPNGGAPGARFDVYRNNVAVSLTEVLEASYPVIRKLVGDEFFKAMAGVYLRKHLPTSPMMMFYGDQMPTFVTRFGPTQGLGYLPDMARLEIAMREAYHAADATPVDAEVIGALSPDALMGKRVTLAPSLAIVPSRNPTLGISRACTDADAPQPVQRSENVLVTRPAFDPIQHEISAAAATFIKALQNGDTLGVALTHAGADLDLGAALGLLLRQRAITDLN